MYIFTEFKRFCQTKRDNFLGGVEIAHFIIKTNGKRIFTPAPRETKIPFGFFI